MEKKDYKLFVSLLLWLVIPSVYGSIRMGIVSVNQIDINILGQMEWFDLIDEVLVTALTVPLFSLLKTNISSKEKNGVAFIISFGIYTVFALMISGYVSGIAEFMNASFASEYLRMQTFSMLIGFISTFCMMLFTLNNDFKMIVVLTIIKLLLLSILDFVFMDSFLELGASYSEIVVNILIGVITLTIAYIRKYIGIGKINFSWLKDYLKIGLYSGLQIFLDNFIYAVMICKMINDVSGAGNYWIANNFIWGWLLLPVMAIMEIIKKNKLEELNDRNTWRYVVIVGGVWLVSTPSWKWFIEHILHTDAGNILPILYLLVPFYLAYIVSSFIDSWFISRGKTIYNLINSCLVNIVYYGIAFLLFNRGFGGTSVIFVILLFGFGNVFHMCISILLYSLQKDVRSLKKT